MSSGWQVGKWLAMAMNKFKSAFHGKRYELLHYLHVDVSLLNCLHDKELLTDLQLGSLRVLTHNHRKVDELFNILGRLEDSLFDVFCSVLVTVGQPAIVRKIRLGVEPNEPRTDENVTSHYAGSERSTCSSNNCRQ